MVYMEDMNKKAIILCKPSGTITIGGDLTEIQRKFYDGFLYVGKKTLEKDINAKWFEIKLSDLKKLLNRKESGKDNKYLKEQIKNLNKIQVEYNILKKDKLIEGFTNLITEGKFITDLETKEIIVKYNLPNMVKEALLKNNKEALFAQINLIIKKNLKHKYSLILYDLIKDYENVEIPEMTIDEFRKIFGLEKKYKYIRDIKKYVLDPAINEINANSEIDFKVSYKLKKIASKYTHIKFIKQQKNYLEKKKQKDQKAIETNKVKALLSLVPEQYRTKSLENFFTRIKNKFEFGYIKAQIEFVNKQERVNNYIAYLKNSILEDFANYEKSIKEEEQNRKEFHEFLLKAQNIYEDKILPKKEVKFEEFLRDYIYIQFQHGNITEKQKKVYLDYWDKLVRNNT